MKTLLLDCDGVIANCASPVHEYCEFAFERKLPPPHTWEEEFPEAMGLSPVECERFQRLFRMGFNPLDVRLHAGALEAVSELKKHFEVLFLTAQLEGSYDWMPVRERLLAPFDCKVIFTDQKHRVMGDLLVDDKASTISKGGPWKGLLFTRPWNASLLGFERVSCLEEVLKYA